MIVVGSEVTKRLSTNGSLWDLLFVERCIFHNIGVQEKINGGAIFSTLPTTVVLSQFEGCYSILGRGGAIAITSTSSTLSRNCARGCYSDHYSFFNMQCEGEDVHFVNHSTWAFNGSPATRDVHTTEVRKGYVYIVGCNATNNYSPRGVAGVSSSACLKTRVFYCTWNNMTGIYVYYNYASVADTDMIDNVFANLPSATAIALSQGIMLLSNNHFVHSEKYVFRGSGFTFRGCVFDSMPELPQAYSGYSVKNMETTILRHLRLGSCDAKVPYVVDPTSFYTTSRSFSLPLLGVLYLSPALIST